MGESTCDGGLALTLEPYGTRVVVFRRMRATPIARKTPVAATEDLRLGVDGELRGDGERRAGGLAALLGGGCRAEPLLGHRDLRAARDLAAGIPEARRPPVPRFRRGAKPSSPSPSQRTLRGNSFAAPRAPPVREAAAVFVGGRRAGSVWASPYRVDLTDLLRDGANEIRIDVYNTAINCLSEGGHLPDTEALVERYGQRFRLQDLEGLRPLASGILSVPRIVAER